MADHPLTVLVVDDEALLRRSIAEVLRRSGHTVIQASSAAAGRDAITDAAGRVDVVLLGDRLQDAPDGQFIEELRQRLPDVALVLMTASGTAETAQAAVERGAFCVLSKPFDLYGIEAVVAAAHRWSAEL